MTERLHVSVLTVQMSYKDCEKLFTHITEQYNLAVATEERKVVVRLAEITIDYNQVEL